jgi:hypothetical protein
MTEVHTGRPETGTAKSNVIDFEAARQKRQAGEKSQIRRTLTPPPTQEDRGERNSAKRQQHIKEELAHTAQQPTDSQAQQQTARTQETDEWVNEMLGGQSEEQITAHNEQVKARQEKEQAEKESVREEALKQYEKHQERLAAMTPEEREAYDRRIEKIRAGVKPLTPEEWTQLLRTWMADIRRGEREKAAWIAERDPRYDPMTGDLLKPDEFPLSPTSEYYFDGKTRGRRFIPPDSPHLKAYKPLQIDEDGERVPESEYHERLAQRLAKAGFVEVEPTLADKAPFEQTQWYRSLSPTEKMHYLQEAMAEMTGEKPWNKETTGGKAGEKVAKFIALLIDFPIGGFSPPEGRLARGFKPPAFSRFLFQSAVKSAESF